jgi:ATP-dependent RNA helicase SUPV3L1/SUV3
MQISTQPQGTKPRVVAVLGPTNTGKTHLAMERMLGFESGMIGFPLRLLARENYDRALKIKSPRQIALITGEEKIIPPEARYFLCTVESMPLTRRVAFLGVDEVQMCADPDRGHVFTDRLLRARGSLETMFMGAETAKPLLRKLVPEAEFINRPRFSTLKYAGQKRISRLPPRSAVVGFSVADVYAIAELIRRQRGGAAIVLGALSPRTRNAQVDMYQAGEVDYLVATDAIGMGLNMKVDHVAFAATRKFDGRVLRELTPAELAQIAGRAGRHMNDGTFGTTADIGPLDPEIAERIEHHDFDPLKYLLWRNSALKFTSVTALKGSLALAPDRRGLLKAREADDELILSLLSKDADIVRLARGPDSVRLLWDVCQIPDFGKVAHDAHARLLGRIYRFLMGANGDGEGRLDNDWVARQVDRIDRSDGDIETLMQRIANIRTWTYVSHHGDWLDDAGFWQERTRAIEDKLSDILHERLIQRFVDRRTAVLASRLKDRQELLAAVNSAGEVLVEGHFVGVLTGLRFVADPSVGEIGAGGLRGIEKAVTATALKALRREIIRRVGEIEAADDATFALDIEGHICWRGQPVAKLAAGTGVLQPKADPLASDLLDGALETRVRRRLNRWLEAELKTRLAPLFRDPPDGVSGPVRGLMFQTAEALGSLPRRQAEAQIAALNREDRKILRQWGLRIGRESIYFADLLKPAVLSLRGQLWATYRGTELPDLPTAGRTSIVVDPAVAKGFYEAIGYRSLGPRAVRVDIVERLTARALKMARKGDFAAIPELLTMVGCNMADMAGILSALGYQVAINDAVMTFSLARRRRSQARTRSRNQNRRDKIASESPFAGLRTLR